MSIENKLQRIIYKFWVKLFCSKVICISEAVKKSASLNSKKCRVIYNPGPDPALFNPARLYPIPENLRKNKCNIITIANFRPVKGQEHFINIASRIEKQCPQKAHFVMIGDRLPAHQQYYNSLIGMITNFNITSRFSIIENVPHEAIPQYIAHSSILLHLPNYQEGFGGVILEAMIMGVPVVAFDSGGVSECFTNHHSGFIVPQFDIDAATDATLKLLQNIDLHNQFSINAMNEVKKFSYQKHFSEIETVYKDSNL
jgi:glycosyltransferase involved in cell wall biosynthesis